ncbi:MAG: TIGR04282 family arsenosugar biosynthesis glycosyltransferase, partial [Gemmatimonadaceae bacterium]
WMRTHNMHLDAAQGDRRAYPRALVLFARAPERGRVKTRLAAGLGDDAALAIYVRLAERAGAAAREVRDCRRVVAYTPAHDGVASAMRTWLGADFAYEPQCDGDLGRRMAGAVGHCLAGGAERVVVIGTDCPDLETGLLEEAFAALDVAELVFGPAEDGGYYLIGVRAVQPVLFEQIPWSSPDTLARSLGAARAAGLSVHLLRTLADIDTADDWQRWCSRGALGARE